MSETKTKTMFNGQLFDGVEVPVAESTERWSEYKLEDGTTLRVKHVVSSIVRLDKVYDPEKNPVYVTKGTNVAATVLVPEHLRFKDK